MFKLDNDFLTSLGLGGLPVDEKNRLLQMIYERLEMNVGMRLAEKMTDQQLDEFESFIDQNNEAGALKWLESNFPNYKDVVAEELEKLRVEVTQAAPQILASSPSQGGVPMQQPQMQPGVPMQPQPPIMQPLAPQPGYAPQQPQYPPAGGQQPQFSPVPQPQQPAFDPSQSQQPQQPAFDPSQMPQPMPQQPFAPQPYQPLAQPVPQPQPFQPAAQAAQPNPPAGGFTPPPPGFTPGQ